MSVSVIEEKIKEKLTGEAQKTALDFTAFLQTEKAITVEQIGDYEWNVLVNGTNSAYVKVSGESNDRWNNTLIVVLHP